MSPVSQSQRKPATADQHAHQAAQRSPKSSEPDASVLQTLLYLQKFAGNAALAELIATREKKFEPDAPQAGAPSEAGPGRAAADGSSKDAPVTAGGTAPLATSGSGMGLLGEIASVGLPAAAAAAAPVAGVFGSLFGSLVAPAPPTSDGKTAEPNGPPAAGAGPAADGQTAGKASDQKAVDGHSAGEAPGGAGPASAAASAGAKAAGAAGAAAASGTLAAGGAAVGSAVANGAAAGPEAATSAPTPENDPNFQAVKAQVHTRAAQSKAHAPAHAKVAESQAAAQGPANEVAAGASAAQVGKMDAQQPGGFDKQAFMAAVHKAIDAAAPQSLEEADDFKESGKAAQVGASVSSLVGQNKDAASKDIKGTTEAAPDASGVQPKPVAPLPAEDAGAPPAPVGAASAMPQPKPAEEVSLAKGPADVNASMEEADVTEEQLKESNEPEFQDALSAKGAAEKHSAEAPQAFRKDEKSILDKSKDEATGSAGKELQAMHGTRAKGLAAVAAGKSQAKAQDEARRAEVSTKIQAIYGKTKDDVTTILNGIDPQVDTMFKAGEEGARAGFESYVQVRMDAYKDDRYSGWRGKLRWAKDKLFGMPDDVNAFYVSGRELYLKKMEAVISNVADLVGRELIRAKQRISQGQLEIQQYVQTLPKDLRKVGQDAQQEIQGKFDELSQAVDSKQDDLVNSLAQKYVAGRDAVDARIKEMKEANKGLVDKAIDAVKGVIETIKKLKDMLLNVLAKAVSVIGSIIAHPIKFLGNLVDGLKTGLSNFMANIGEHLKKGLLGWLFGALGEAGLTLPEKFDLKGILSIIMQILGLTYSHIRGLAVGIVGEEMVGHLEKSLEFFQILIKEGPAGLWKWIVEKLSELKDTVMEKIKEFIQEKVIIAGIMWLLGLLNPVAAFIKACKAIYDIVKFFIERAQQVGELIDAILDSIGAVVGGNLGEMAGKVENALAKAIPVAIGFLASLLGLGGISDKIRSIIHAIQEPIHNIISKVLGVVLKPFKWIGNKLKQGAAWAKKKVQQGVAFVKEKAKAGVAYVKGKAAGVFGKKETPQSMGVKAKAHDELHKRTGKPFASVDQLRATVQGVLETLRPEGLKDLKLKEGAGANQYDIVAVASPAETVDHATVAAKDPVITYSADSKGRPALSSGGPLVNKTEERVKGEEFEALTRIRNILPIGQGGYEAGHLIADRFGGSSEKKNLVPLAFRTNHSWMGVFESFVADLIRGGKRGEIYASVRPVYPDSLREQVPAQGRDAQGNIQPMVEDYITMLEWIPDQLDYTVEGEKDGARSVIKSEVFSAEDRGNLPKAVEAAKAAGHKRGRDLYESNDPKATVKAKARAELGTFLKKPVHSLEQLQGIAQEILGRLRNEGLKNLTVAPGKAPNKYEIFAEASPVEMVAEATLEEQPGKAGAGKSGPLSGKEVDEAIDASQSIKSYVETKVKGGIKADGHVHIHEDAAFTAAYVKYAISKQNPATGKLFTPDEARARAPRINGFRDGTEIHVHAERAETTTTIHESIHLYSDDAFKNQVGKNANEGITEFFTREICAEQKLSRSGFYEDELEAVRNLVALVGREKLAAAYFQGNVSPLEAAVNSKGAGRFATWCRLMKAGKFEDAGYLLK